VSPGKTGEHPGRIPGLYSLASTIIFGRQLPKGYFLIATKRTLLPGWAINLSLAIFSLTLVIVLIEVILSSGIMDGEKKAYPVWVPPKFQEANERINARNFNRAGLNWNGFNSKEDIFYTENGYLRFRPKEAGKKRIAVLGDSVVWGRGLPYEDIWSIKLKGKLEPRHENLEVYSWGRSGWDTIDYYLFLAELTSYLELKGIESEPDILIISHFVNDPNFWFRQPRYITWHESPAFKPLKKALPLTFSFVTAHINNILRDIRGPEYYSEDYYSDINLFIYQTMLIDLAKYCRLKGIKLIFAMVPHRTNKEISEKFDAVKPLLRAAGIEHLDLFTPAYDRFKDYNQRELRANPADNHPGELLTELFAEEVMKYLEEKGYLGSSFSSPEPMEDAAEERRLLKRLVAIADKKDLKIGPYVIKNMDDRFEQGPYNFINDHRSGYIARKLESEVP
jgi:hypothetical protein